MDRRVKIDASLQKQALQFWNNGQMDEVGKLIFEAILPVNRPLWAGQILNYAILRTNIDCAEMKSAADITKDPRKWHKGHDIFRSLRRITLQLDKLGYLTSDQQVMLNVVLLAESVSKVVYNESNPDDPFDEDAGWWIADRLHSLCETLNDPEFSKTAWSLLSLSEENPRI